MREHKSFLRSAFDALIEARFREADRTLAHFDLDRLRRLAADDKR